MDKIDEVIQATANKWMDQGFENLTDQQKIILCYLRFLEDQKKAVRDLRTASTK